MIEKKWGEYLAVKYASDNPEEKGSFYCRDRDYIVVAGMCFIHTLYFDKYPRRSKLMDDTYFIKNEPEMVAEFNEFISELSEERYRKDHETYLVLSEYFLALPLPEPSEEKFLHKKSFYSDYMSQGQGKRKYAFGSLMLDIVVLEFFGYSTYIVEHDDGVELWANVPVWYIPKMFADIPSNMQRWINFEEYRRLWQHGINPKVLYPFISGWGNEIDFVRDYRQLPTKEIVEKWVARNV